MNVRAALSALLAVALMSLSDTRAEPLDAAVCAKVAEEHAALISAGVPGDMTQGPQWAKANLSKERLERIARYISIDEQLNFRCGLAKQKIVLPTTQEGGEELLPGPDGPNGVVPVPPTTGAPGARKGVEPPPKQERAARTKRVVKSKEPASEPAQDASKAPARRKAARKAAGPGSTEAVGSDAAPAAPRRSKARTKTVEGDARQAPKVDRAKARKKVDDAYRPAARPKAVEPAAAPSGSQ